MPNLSMARIRSWAPIGLASLFVVSGTLHVVRPSFFESLVPSVLPARDVIVLTSGIAELVCAAGLLTGARWAGSASAWLLVAVFPLVTAPHPAPTECGKRRARRRKASRFESGTSRCRI